MWNVCEYLEQWHLQSLQIPSPLSPPEHMMLLPSGQVLRHSLPPHLSDRELRLSRHTISISVPSSTLMDRMQKITVWGNSISELKWKWTGWNEWDAMLPRAQLSAAALRRPSRLRQMVSLSLWVCSLTPSAPRIKARPLELPAMRPVSGMDSVSIRFFQQPVRI